MTNMPLDSLPRDVLYDFSISILTLGNQQLLEACIKSIFESKTTLYYQLIISDQASKDDTLDYIKDLAKKHDHIVVIENEKNLGFIGGHRKALDFALGKYFLMLNDDVEVSHNWLEAILEGFSDPRVRVVGPRACVLTKTGRGMAAHGNPNPDYIEGSCFAVPVTFARYYGLFSNYLQMAYCEDSDLSLKARAMGFKIKETPFKMKHVGSATARTTDLDIKGYSVINHEMLRQHWGYYLSKKSFRETVKIKRKMAVGDVFLLTPIIAELKVKNVFKTIFVSTDCPQLLESNPDCVVRPNDFKYNTDNEYNLDMAYESRPNMHIVDAYAEAMGLPKLLRRLPVLYLSNDEIKWAKENCASLPDDYFVLHAGPTNWPGRNLPESTFMKVVEVIKNELGYPVYEIGHAGRIANTNKKFLRVNWKQSAGLIMHAKGFIGIDSAPMHIAQAFEIPSAVIFGCINPKCRIVIPALTQAVIGDVACKFCHHWRPSPRTFSDCLRGEPECMKQIKPEKILQSLEIAMRNKAFFSETAKIRDRVLAFCKGKGIDIGCKDDKIVPTALGIDRKPAKGVDKVLDASAPLPYTDGEFDYVYSSHCLEDIEDTERTLAEWLRILRKGGYIILYLPHKDLYRGTNIDHKHNFVNRDITVLLEKLGCVILRDVIDYGDDRYSFLIVGQKHV